MFYAVSPYSHIGQHQNQSMSYIVTSCSPTQVSSRDAGWRWTYVFYLTSHCHLRTRTNPHHHRHFTGSCRDRRIQEKTRTSLSEVTVAGHTPWGRWGRGVGVLSREVTRGATAEDMPRTCRGHAEVADDTPWCDRWAGCWQTVSQSWRTFQAFYSCCQTEAAQITPSCVWDGAEDA